MRDRNLDIYRGAIMIYITCFCHLIWWEGVKVGIFEGPDKKSRDPLLEVCIGLFSGCCVSLLEVGRDNTVE